MSTTHSLYQALAASTLDERASFYAVVAFQDAGPVDVATLSAEARLALEHFIRRAGIVPSDDGPGRERKIAAALAARPAPRALLALYRDLQGAVERGLQRRHDRVRSASARLLGTPASAVPSARAARGNVLAARARSLPVRALPPSELQPALRRTSCR